MNPGLGTIVRAGDRTGKLYAEVRMGSETDNGRSFLIWLSSPMCVFPLASCRWTKYRRARIHWWRVRRKTRVRCIVAGEAPLLNDESKRGRVKALAYGEHIIITVYTTSQKRAVAESKRIFLRGSTDW